MALRRQLDRCRAEVQIKMQALGIDAAGAAMPRMTFTSGLYFALRGMRSGKGKSALYRHGRGRVSRVGLPVLSADAAGLTEHAQVQRDHADKKEYRKEVFLQSSPILENGPSELLSRFYQADAKTT